MRGDSRQELIDRILVFSESIWEGQLHLPALEAWLANFDGSALGDREQDQLHALHLLASMSYFGLREIRELLKAMYRDLFRYPLIQQVRDGLPDDANQAEILAGYEAELRATRFLGVGRPAESGTHLLYYFRQQAALSVDRFVSWPELVTGPLAAANTTFVDPDIARLVFLDDVCGSGTQAKRYSRSLLADIQTVAARGGRPIEFHYLVLFATTHGLREVRTKTAFGDNVHCVLELDAAAEAFGPDSHLFTKPLQDIDAGRCRAVAEHYGLRVDSQWPLGFKNNQLLLALHHNTPNNTLPIMWSTVRGWTPAFHREGKVL